MKVYSLHQAQKRHILLLGLLLAATFDSSLCFPWPHNFYCTPSFARTSTAKRTIGTYVSYSITSHSAVASPYADSFINEATSSSKEISDESQRLQESKQLGKLQSLMTKVKALNDPVIKLCVFISRSHGTAKFSILIIFVILYSQVAMITFITGMCIALPLTLFPINILHRVGIISTRQREFSSLRAGELCSFVLLRLVPFTRIQIINDGGKNDGKLVNDPSIWVCNHSSMIDVFILLATIRRNRPIKVIYWKGLEANPVTRWLFKSCGFIPVQMAGNGSGVKNEYDRSSFKDMLKSAKKAFAEGFDLGVLPEGQLNPTPENGLLEVYPGAYTLSKMSKMPIRMAALYGTHNLWHPVHGMKPLSRNVKVRIYSQPLTFSSSQQFIKTFENIVGHFGATGTDLPNHERQQLFSLETNNVESDST